MKISFAALVLASAACLSAQPAKPLAFDAASVKLSAPMEFGRGPGGPGRMGVKYDASRLTITSMPLRDLIASAYRLKTYQVDAPDFSKSTLVDITAALPAGETEAHIPEMLQTLLAERFGLHAHESTVDQPVYVMTAKKGIALKAAPPDDPDAPPVHTDPKGPDFGMMGRLSNSTISGDPMRGMLLTTAQGQTMKMTMSGAGIHIESSKLSMPELAEELTMFVDLPVIDKTGLTGNYQIALDLSMEDMMNVMRKQGFGGGPPPGDFPGGPGGGGPGGSFGGGVAAPGAGQETSGGSIMTSIQQLGLKLEKTNAPGPLLSIDHLEKTPTEN